MVYNQPTCDQVARYYDDRGFKNSWLIVALSVH